VLGNHATIDFDLSGEHHGGTFVKFVCRITSHHQPESPERRKAAWV
jgi:hypothetical protein